MLIPRDVLHDVEGLGSWRDTAGASLLCSLPWLLALFSVARHVLALQLERDLLSTWFMATPFPGSRVRGAKKEYMLVSQLLFTWQNCSPRTRVVGGLTEGQPAADLHLQP